MEKNFFIGIDGGGTYTRVAIADRAGHLLSYVNHKGASSFAKDLKATENVQTAISVAAQRAGCQLTDAIALAAGIAGFDQPSDLERVQALTAMEPLCCPQTHVNDAVAALAGAFYGKPGIIAISGTGSIVFGITETGRQIRNYSFGHYAGAARHLTKIVLFDVLSGIANEADAGLVEAFLKHFQVENLSVLAERASVEFLQDDRARTKLLGDIAPAVTEAASHGSRLAQKACTEIAALHVTGIRLLGACFDLDEIPVALIGSVANSGFIKEAIRQKLSDKANHHYTLREPALPAALGAVLLAMEHANTPITARIMENLNESAAAIAAAGTAK